MDKQVLTLGKAYAATPCDGCINDSGIPTLKIIPFFLSNIISFTLLLAGFAAVYFVIISGIKFITSGGDQVKLQDAKNTMTFAIVGLVLVILSFALIKLFSTITGVDCNVLGVAC